MKRWTLLSGTLALTVATFGTAVAQPRDLPDGPNRMSCPGDARSATI